MLADLLLEGGAAAEALQEYEAVLKTAPRRFNATAGAAKAADRLPAKREPAPNTMQLLEISGNAETARPEFGLSPRLSGRQMTCYGNRKATR